MSYKQMERRLAAIEQEARSQQQARIESMSDAELDALIAEFAERDPVGNAAVEAMSAEDLDRLCDGRMPAAEWEQHRERAAASLNT